MYHIIVNPVSGKRGKRSARNLKTLARVFDEYGKQYAVYTTSRAGEAREIARKITSEEADAELVVVGGDGTVHEVLNGVADPTRCRLGVIPSGTGNDFAEATGISPDAEKTARFIAAGSAKPTDYLEIGGVRCLNAGGLGMDVDVLLRCKKGKWFKGRIKYFISLLQSLFAFKGCEIEVEQGGGRRKYKALLAAACNGSQFGGGIPVCPPSVVDDGKMDVMIVECMGKLQILKAFSYLLKGKVTEYPAAKHFLADAVDVFPASPVTVQLDGELYDGLPFKARIFGGLKIYRP